MTGFLLDTNCISEEVKPHPNPGVVSWMREVDPTRVFLSVLTLGEILYGIGGLAPGRNRLRLETWLDVDIRVQFSERLLPVTANIAERWASITRQTKARGRALPAIDGLLAATALEHNLTLATRNTKDFDIAQVSVFNPWT
jgi:predicted nucleic acid-binding protein